MRYSFFVIGLLYLIASPAVGHDIYSDWKTGAGHSCCSNNDCAPAPARYVNGGVEFFINGQWHVAPPLARLPFDSPDGQNHACFYAGRILCWTLGTGT